MKSGQHTRLSTGSDRAIDAAEFSNSEENTLRIDEQIFATEHNAPSGGGGDKINGALTRVSEFSGAIDQPETSWSRRRADDEPETTWELLAKALQRVKILEKADCEKSLALTECCNHLTEVCELWNQQALELKLVCEERDHFAAVIANLNEKIESERAQLSGEKQLRMLSEENCRALQAETQSVQIECVELSKRLLDCEIALDNKTSELASLREKFDRSTQHYAETNRTLRHQYEEELGKRARSIAQQNKIIKDLRSGQQAVACTRFRRHRVRCFDGTGGASWRGGSSRESSSLRQCA